jgi:hypothetical protein
MVLLKKMIANRQWYGYPNEVAHSADYSGRPDKKMKINGIVVVAQPTLIKTGHKCGMLFLGKI